MAYQPLFLKYRPQTFAQLVGQDPIVATLSSALRSDRLAQAYLFTGSRGTGKTSTARILAKAVNCEQGATAAPCGHCRLCVSITQGNALDVIEIDAASNTGVDNIRELIERANLAPALARYKVYVIDECHMLSGAAFNALLKTLEEPPPQVIFILATTDPQRVLPTIISRCQRFDFKRIPLEAMAAHLTKLAELESINITPAAVELVAQLAQGGLRDAESLLDQLGLLPGPVEPTQVWDLVGAVPERDLLELLSALQTQDTAALIGHCRQIIDRGREPIQVLQDLVGFLRDALLAKVTSERSWSTLTQSTWAKLVSLGPTLDQVWLLQAQSVLRAAEPQIKHSTQPRLWLEVALLEAARTHPVAESVPPSAAPVAVPAAAVKVAVVVPAPPPTSPAPAPIATPVTKVSTPAPAPAASSSPPPKPPVNTAPIAPVASAARVGGLKESWTDFLNQFKPSTKGLLRGGEVLREDEQKIVLGFPSLFFVNKLREAKLRDELHQVAERVLGRRVSVSCELTSEVTAPADSPKAASAPAKAVAPAPINAIPLPTPHPTPVPVVSAAPRDKNIDRELDATAKSLAHFFNGTIVTGEETAPVAPREDFVAEEEEF